MAMLISSRGPTLRRAMLYIFGVSSVVLLTFVTIFVMLDIPLLYHLSIPLFVPALLASIVNPVTLFMLVATTLLYHKALAAKHSRYRSVVPLTTIIIATLGTCLSLSTIMIKRSKVDVINASHPLSVQPITELILWAVSIILEIGFFISLIFIVRASEEAQPSQCAEKTLDVTSLSYQRDMQQRVLPRTGSPLLPPWEMDEKPARRNWRGSLRSPNPAVVIPQSDSKTQLVIQRRTSISQDSVHSSTDKDSSLCDTPTDKVEGFDGLAVNSRLQEHIDQSNASTRPHHTILEPIPGSRPTSQMLATMIPPPLIIEQPSTPQKDERSEENPSSSPLRSPTTSLYTSDRENPSSPSTRNPRRTTRTPRPTLSRSGTPTVEESNIHPLFRTDSPAPPPLATPGTVITASPFSGSVIPIPPRAASRTRSVSSRNPSPSLRRAISLNEHPSTTSLRSQRSIPASPIEDLSIPDFVAKALQERMGV